MTPFDPTQIVEPLDQPGFEAQVEQMFVEAGWPNEDARWLAEISVQVVESRRLPESLSEYASEQIIGPIVRSWSESAQPASRDRALLFAFARLVERVGATPPASRETTASTSDSSTVAPLSTREIADRFRAHEANFEAALVEGGWPGTYDDSEIETFCRATMRDGDDEGLHDVPKVLRLMRTLTAEAKLDLTKVIDWSAIHAAGLARTEHMATPPVYRAPMLNRFQVDRINPRALTTWMFALGPSALPGLRDILAREPSADRCATLAIGIQDSIERWINAIVQHWTFFEHFGPDLADGTEPLMLELEERLTVSLDDRLLRQSWLWFARVTAEADPTRIPDKREDCMLRVANEELARLRPLFARARLRPQAPDRTYPVPDQPTHDGETPSWLEFECEREHFENCAVVLHLWGGVWAGMKPLLLALRSLSCPAVADDLRYWREERVDRKRDSKLTIEQPPDPWGAVPATMINLFQAVVGSEQADDPQLEELRGELAAFCLRGLADRWTAAQREDREKRGVTRKNEDMLERSPVWRYCMIRAAMALNINPEGKGHRLLDKASRIDPDEAVRTVAREAYEKLRRGHGVSENVSPRRMIMTALWWVRQAHLHALGVEIDADGAQRTRVKELTRTKQQERTDKEELN